MPNSNETLYPIQFVVSRPGPKHESVTAVVTAKVNRLELKEGDKFVQILTEAVTEWVKTTKAGKACFNYAGDDINIGDLCCYGDLELRKILEQKGIYEFLQDPSEYCSSDYWTYDTVLINADETDDDELIF